MAKRVTMINEDTGRVVTYKQTRARTKSETTPIPLTPAPKTAWQKFLRSAVH